MSKKVTSVILFLILFINSISFAQTDLEPVVIGDTVVLTVNGASGDVQWQMSTDSVLWDDIPGAVTNPYEHIAISSPSSRVFYRASITDSSICENLSWYSAAVGHRLIDNTDQLHIGEWFRGGIVINTEASGTGLLAAPIDQAANIPWCIDTSDIGAYSTTDGANNTALIAQNCSDGPSSAAGLCYSLVLNDYDDWFLPAKDQLNFMYQQQVHLNGLDHWEYWSSTESNTDSAWYQFFDYGFQFENGKSLVYDVRCVRSYAQHGKTYLYSIITSSPQENIVIVSQPLSQIKCIGDSVFFELAVTGTAPVSYQWKKNGNIISGATDEIYSITDLVVSDEGTYTCNASNLCNSIVSIDSELKIIQLTVDAGSDIEQLTGYPSVLQATYNSNHITESGAISYSWSPSAGLSSTDVSNPTAGPDTTTYYAVYITDEAGCTATDSVSVNILDPFNSTQICLVSVDTIEWKNKVMWEIMPDVGIESVRIYKEVAANIYNWLGDVSVLDSSYFIDYSSQPEAHSDRYKITAVDTNGTESVKSLYHNTINLVVSSFGSTMGLVWTPYQTEGNIYLPDQYFIYKGPTPETLQLLTTVTGNQNTYNDFNVFDLNYYLVAVLRDCNIQPAFSNRRSNGMESVGDIKLPGTILISPNPMTTYTILEIPNFEIRIPKSEKTGSGIDIRIYDLTGKVVRSELLTSFQSEIEIERRDLKPGIFFVELKADRMYRGKLVVE